MKLLKHKIMKLFSLALIIWIIFFVTSNKNMFGWLKNSYEKQSPYNQHKVSLDTDAQLKLELSKASKQLLTVVVWSKPPKLPDNFITKQRNCGWCNITADKRKIHDNTTKAIVFHFKELKSTELPRERRSDQLYVWWDRESSQTVRRAYHMQLTEFENFFNMTMTYRRDSDISVSYGKFSTIVRPFRTSGNTAWHATALKKKKLAIWIVSDCKFTKFARTRMKFSNKLIQAGLKLDRKGGCFPPYRRDSNKSEISNYKFYMAFENSYHCKDYITEKVFENSFKMDAVPVVLGATKSDYEAVIPPGSFIFVEDFKTPKNLVDYLNYLDKNDTAYREYFEWRTLKVEDLPNYQRTTGFCQLCRVLHGINVDNIYNEKSEELGSYIPLFGYPNKSRVVPSLRDWFYGTENRDCLPSY